MRILLITPPPYDYGANSRFLERLPIQSYTMPLGIGYIAAFLEENGYKTDILDAYIKKMSYDDISEYIKSYNPDVIGITCLSDQRGAWFKLIHVIRAINDKIKIVLGGPHPSLMLHQVLLALKPDAIVIGEGEETMLELIKAWDSGKWIGDIKGIAYMNEDTPVVTESRDRIRELDKLPFPARHLVNMEEYLGWEFIRFLSERIGLDKPPRYATVITSRGCIGKCGYCSSPLIWRSCWTYRSAVNIADEIEMLVRDYGIEFIIFTDDIFTVNQKRVIELSREILKRNIRVLWVFETAVSLVSPEMLHEAKSAGCCCILYGVESGSANILSNISKKIREQEVENAFAMTKDAGILAGAFLMVGNPGETEKSIDKTISLLKKIDPDIILPQIVMVTPNTKIYEIAKSKGFITDDFWLTDAPFPYYMAERKLSTLLRWHRKLYYYKHSKFGIMLRTLRDFIEFRTGFRITRNGLIKTERVV